MGPDGALDPVAFPSFVVEKDPYLGAEEILAVVYLLLQIQRQAEKLKEKELNLLSLSLPLLLVHRRSQTDLAAFCQMMFFCSGCGKAAFCSGGCDAVVFN